MHGIKRQFCKFFHGCAMIIEKLLPRRGANSYTVQLLAYFHGMYRLLNETPVLDMFRCFKVVAKGRNIINV